MTTDSTNTTAAAAAPSTAAAGTFVIPVTFDDDGPIGMVLQATDGGRGALITEVTPSGQADRAGIQAGDVPVFGGGVSFGKKIPHQAVAHMLSDKIFAVMRQGAPNATTDLMLSLSSQQSTAQKAKPSKPGTSGSNKKMSTLSDVQQKDENVPNGAAPAAKASSTGVTGSASLAAAAAGTTATGGNGAFVESTTALLAMSKAELQHQLDLRSIQWKKKNTIADLLEMLGIPAKKWHRYRKMKVAQLKDELKKENKKVTGNKHELLLRLGVPDGFGESSHETMMRQHKEKMKAAKKKRKANPSSELAHLAALMERKQRSVRDEDDPTHDHYEIPCCANPRVDYNREPSGMITWPDGSISEVWRCLACGKIPEQPNAPPIEEFSSDDECDELGHSNGRPECIIQ